jgi:hypothetical protein
VLPQPTQIAQSVSPKVEKEPTVVENQVIVEPTSTVAIAQTVTSNPIKTTEKTVILRLPEITEAVIAANNPTTTNQEESSLSSKSTFDESLITQPRKSTRMAKVWQQLKKAKDGEKVDWDEVGFNPNKLIAKATGKTKQNQ